MLMKQSSAYKALSSLYYDLVGDLIDGHISLTSHKLNKTIYLISVVTAIFVLLGILASLYGMNFDYIPEQHIPYGYFFLVNTMYLILASLMAETWLWCKRRDWKRLRLYPLPYINLTLCSSCGSTN
jgi:Mg2+ and Co2+ transporter CorA